VLRRRIKTGLAVALAAGVLTSFAVATASAAGTLYTNNYNEKQLAALSIGADGLLTPLTGSPFEVADYFDGLAITPDGQTMVTSFGFNNLLGSLSLGANGAPSPAASPFAAELGGAPAITPDGRFVYIPHEPSGLLAYAIGAGGSLTKIGGTFGVGNGGTPAITPNGRFVLAPDFTGGTVERFAIQADGSLTPLGATPIGFEGPNVVRVTPDGKFAVLLSTPSGNDDIRTFAIGSDGSLTPTGSALETTGAVSGPPVISPNGAFVYVANGNEESITTYSIGASGALSQVGVPAATGISQIENLALSVDGRFLYAEPQSGQLLQAFSVAADGTLTKIGSPASTGGFSDGSMPTARPSAPVASFTAKAGPPHAKTTFDASASSDVGAKIVSYTWDFGDGAKLTTASPQVSHSYSAPGVYTARLSVTDDNNCSGFSYTGQTAYCGGRDATLSVDTLPVIYSLLATPARFFATPTGKGKKKRKPGTTLHYKLSEKARVTFAVQRKLKGHKVGKSCKPLSPKDHAAKPKCTLLRAIGRFSTAGKAGKNKKRFSGKLKGRRLPPGAYRVVATAVDSAGGKSAPRSANFKVKTP
jgi:PKD repeat protein